MLKEERSGVKERVSPSLCEDPPFEVRNSPIQGKGLFSNFSISANIRLIKLRGTVVRHRYDPALSPLNPNWIGIGYEEWLQLHPSTEGMYINHSCNSNVIVDSDLWVVTLRSIEANEELMLDYSTTELDPYWSMKCACKQLACRKTIRAFKSLSPALQEHYGSHMHHVFLNTANVQLHHKAHG